MTMAPMGAVGRYCLMMAATVLIVSFHTYDFPGPSGW